MLFISENFLNSFKVPKYTLIIYAVDPEFSTAALSSKNYFVTYNLQAQDIVHCTKCFFFISYNFVLVLTYLRLLVK